MKKAKLGKLYRRFISLLLAAVFVLSGCGSIILDGNLTFEANPPISSLTGGADAWINGDAYNAKQQAIDNITFAYGNVEKYSIEGVRAFTILPGHMSPSDVPALNEVINNVNAGLDPKDAIDQFTSDFRVLDYDDVTGRFVYCYYVPYVPGTTTEYTDTNYIEVSNTGLSVSRSGNARNYTSARPAKMADVKGMVFVLMSYEPSTGNYTVFFSKVFSMEEHKANDIRMLAGKVAGEHDYFALANNKLYMYDRNGSKKFTSDYSSVISSKAAYMIEQYQGIRHGTIMSYSTQINDNTWKASNVFYWRYIVADVEVDENYMPYITLNIELSLKDFNSADAEAEDIVNNDEDVEDTEDESVSGASAEKVGDITYFHGTFACLRINLDESGLQFVSDLSQDAVDALTSTGQDSITITREINNYSEMRQSIESMEDGIEEPTNREDVPDVSRAIEAPAETQVYETYDQTLARLMGTVPDGAEDLNLMDMFKESFNDHMNDFSVFAGSVGSGEGAMRFSLGGSSTGRDTYYYDESGKVVRHMDYLGYGWSYSQLFNLTRRKSIEDWTYGDILYDYNTSTEMIASYANTRNYYIPFLMPGDYGAYDWAYYDIGQYHEMNGSYSIDGENYFMGHAQPLVSNELYVSDPGYHCFNSCEKVNPREAHVDIGEDGQMSLTGAVGLWNGPFQILDSEIDNYYYLNSSGSTYGFNQYYYNDTLRNDFSFDLETIRSSYTGHSVRNANKLSFYLPYTLAYHTTSYSDGSVQREYSTIQNDNPRTYILPTMVLEKTRDITLTYQYILTDGTRSDVYYTKTETVTIPTEYRMVYPKGSYIQISGNIWIGNMVKTEQFLPSGLPETRNGALTYYTVKGDRLAMDKIYGWSLRDKYPIYDNAPNVTVWDNSNTRGFIWWLDYYFLRSDAFWNFYYGNKDKYFSTIQVNQQGVDSIIYDRLVPGQAQDLGVWKDDGRNYIAYFTDQVVRFYEYKPEEGKFRATAQISLDELQMLSEGYFLREKTDGWISSVSENTESVSQLAEDAMNSDEDRITLTADNIIPINGFSRFLYFSDAGSLYLMTLINGGEGSEDWQKHGRLMPLMDGTYYRVFENGDSYKVVGFQTSSYGYNPADQCMARVYDIDIDKLVQSRADESVGMYLESLRNIYLSDNHTLLKTVTETDDGQYSVSYSIVPPDPDDPEYSRAVRLFESPEETVLAELDAICKEYDVERSDAMVAKVKELSDRLRTQRKALTEMYDFLGIAFTGIPTTWQYLQYEGWLYNASHESIIETMMVEIVLSDDYLDPSITPQQDGFEGLIGVHQYDPATDGPDVKFVDDSLTGGVAYVDEFAEYRDQYRLWEANARGNIDNMTVLSGDDLTGQLVTAFGDTSYISQITDMEFYNKVLEAIKEEYLQGLN
ncbi:MAG: hypothetical protein J6U50_07800 [Lachnospiraceae bacterium]|nr:hypothetical protein [Lachnospiraceae bacterium]